MGTIVLTGGGTGGHIIPNLALLPQLGRYFSRIVYLAGDGMEARLVPAAGIPFYRTETVKLDRSHLLENFKIPFVMRRAIEEAKSILDTEKPDIVFSKGGYAALPTCYAAKARKIPVVVHESDYSLGLANRLCARFAAAVLTSFPETGGGILTGNPVREELFKGDADLIRRRYGIQLKPVVLIFGGSLGAEAINRVVEEALPRLIRKYFVIHIAGKSAAESVVASDYVRLSFSDEMPHLYAAADYVVCRGGANSLAEATALGKRTLCIPLPKGVSRGDQELNAESYRKRGLIRVLPQPQLSPDSLLDGLEALAAQQPKTPPKAESNDAIIRVLLDVLRQSNQRALPRISL